MVVALAQGGPQLQPPHDRTADGRGGGAFRDAVLRPRVVVAEASMTEPASEAHEQAHEWCFIANSVNFPIRIEPVIEVDG